jgi:hypothetical protein
MNAIRFKNECRYCANEAPATPDPTSSGEPVTASIHPNGLGNARNTLRQAAILPNFDIVLSRITVFHNQRRRNSIEHINELGAKLAVGTSKSL